MRWTLTALAVGVLALLAFFFIRLYVEAHAAFAKAGVVDFVFGNNWDVANNVFEALPLMVGTLITSGVPILEGLSITARTSGNAVLEEALMKVRKAIEEGRTIVDPLRECGVFPNMVTQMIGVGEATGAMDNMLQKIADFYEDEVDSATKDMLAMLEPVIIGLLGVMIGGIVISLYMPLFAMIAKLAG